MSDRYFVRGEIWFAFHVKANDFKEAQDKAKEVVKQKIQSIFEECEIWWVLATPKEDVKISEEEQDEKRSVGYD